MLQKLTIQHFRGFRELEINRLGRVNLFTGRNNAGKTSVLEAAFLLSGGGNARMAVNANIVRKLATSRQAVASVMWRPLFYSLETHRPVSLQACHSSLGDLELQLNLTHPETIKMPLDGQDESTLSAIGEPGLDFEFTGSGGETSQGRVRPGLTDIEIEQAALDVPFPCSLLSSSAANEREDAMTLGQLRTRKQGELLLEALRVIEPRLTLVEDSAASGEPMIWCDIGLDELVPLASMGDGMVRIARVVLAIAGCPGGVVLIDEVENGLHHGVLSKIWRVVQAAAEKFDVQVFATTHSFECVSAAHHALGKDGLFLHRLEKDGDTNRCVTYTGEKIEAAIRHDLEVR